MRVSHYELAKVNSWERVCPPAVLGELGGLMQAARQAADGQEPYCTRVDLIYKAVYGMMAKNCETHNFGYVKHPDFR